DVVEAVIDVRLLRAVDHHQTRARGDQPGRDRADADVIQVVENLEAGKRQLVRHVAAVTLAERLAERLVGRRPALTSALRADAGDAYTDEDRGRKCSFHMQCGAGPGARHITDGLVRER